MSAMRAMRAKKPYIGGQAVIEGVMMRAPTCLSIAVRRPDGTLVVREGLHRARFGGAVSKIPGMRGIATLVESLSLGFSALRFSAEQQMTDAERADAKSGGNGVLALSTLIAVVVFIALPQLFTAILAQVAGFDWKVQDPEFHLVTGGFKLAILLAYLVVIGRVPEIKRVFQYHGAEHKTIYAYEKQLPLTVENVRAQSTLHPRCGTTFLVFVVVISIVLGSILTPILLPTASGILAHLETLGLRIALLPLVAALSFELQRFSARYCTRGPLRALLWPGFAVQKITTREPEDAQIEIAICAMQAAAWRERVGATVAPSVAPRVFPSFAELLAAFALDATEPSVPLPA